MLMALLPGHSEHSAEGDHNSNRDEKRHDREYHPG